MFPGERLNRGLFPLYLFERGQIRLFITIKRYNEERDFANRRMAEFEKTLHELYDEHLKLREKYNQLLGEMLSYKNATDARLRTIEYDMSLGNGDTSK